jgi:hypothetical protein
MPDLSNADWSKVAEGIYPEMRAEERESLAKTWAANYARFAPLKARLTGEDEPDPVFSVGGGEE